MRQSVLRWSGLARGFCVLLAGLATSAAAAAADTVPPSRAAVWRSIFARPAAPPAPPASQARLTLGRDLFHDKRLSGSQTASCASCHDQARAFTDGRKTAIGPGGAVLTRNAPPLYDLAWASSFFWDGRAPSLEAQARFPILNTDELAGSFPEIVARLKADAAMPRRFEAAFPDRPVVDEENILAAIAAWERTLVSPETRFDRWVAGDDAALDAEEQAGFSIFVGKGACVSCHGGWRLTDGTLHDIGLPLPPGADPQEFKTPSLREVTHTAPYMHDGSFATLAEVVEHYAGGLARRPSLAPTINRELSLSPDERKALIRFLEALSSTSKAE